MIGWKRVVPGLVAIGLAAAGAAAQARNLPEFADLVERAGPGVVNIRTVEKVKAEAPRSPQFPVPEGMDENDPFFEFFRRFFPPRQGAPRGRGGEVPRGVGSGFIISSDGLLLTNHHVVDGADEIYVTLTDKREYRGKLIGSDRRTDVALVKIEARNLPNLTIGDSNKLRVGEWVLAIGSPFGLENTVTAGIVSAKGRDTGDYLPFIQTDVAVNPGNSGGPLINMNGEVIGINSQIYSRTGGFMGISFAIPIDEAMRVADQLKTSGRVVRGRIGVAISEVTKEVAEPLGLERARGALVRTVEAGAPAERAGVEAGDIILRFDGKEIVRSSDLPRMVGSTRPGTRASLQVWRRGKLQELAITVGEMAPDKTADAGRAGRGAPEARPKASADALGLVVSDIPATRRKELRGRSGVQVESVTGAAEEAGIRAGDILLSLNNREIENARQFGEIVKDLERGRAAVLLVQRGEAAQYVPLKPAG